MKRPIPAEIPFFRFSGIPFTIASRTLKKERMMKISPSKSTAVSATVNAFSPRLLSSPRQIVYAKYAFSPSPAERAIG